MNKLQTVNFKRTNKPIFELLCKTRTIAAHFFVNAELFKVFDNLTTGERALIVAGGLSLETLITCDGEPVD